MATKDAAPAAAGKRPTKREEDLGPPAPMRKITNGTTVVSLGASWQLLPNLKLLPFSDSKDREIASFYGPLDENDESLKEHQTHIVGRSVSTYPYLMGVRCGDPNCDRFAIKSFTNRSIIAISDGCNWGPPPREASEKANTFMRKNQKKLTDTHTLGHYLYDAINEAHRAVCAKKIEGEDAAGTTTLLGGMLAKQEQGNQWVFTCINVGDCKAFHFQMRTKTIIDITEGNRTSLKNARDPGGRLGGFVNSKPDLRNLALYQQTLEEGDILMIVSDGVHDNLDPQALGVQPQELLMEQPDWQDVPDEECQDAKSKFRLRLLSILLSKEEWTPHNIVQRVIKHATNVTKKTREWMQANPTKREPTDTKAFPGKMDHTTCLCIRVGPLS